MIQYALSEDSRVILKVYNVLGQEIQILLDKFQHSGIHQLIWDGRGKFGESVANGIYFYKLTVEGNNHKSAEIKMLLLK